MPTKQQVTEFALTYGISESAAKKRLQRAERGDIGDKIAAGDNLGTRDIGDTGDIGDKTGTSPAIAGTLERGHTGDNGDMSPFLTAGDTGARYDLLGGLPVGTDAVFTRPTDIEPPSELRDGIDWLSRRLGDIEQTQLRMVAAIDARDRRIAEIEQAEKTRAWQIDELQTRIDDLLGMMDALGGASVGGGSNGKSNYAGDATKLKRNFNWGA